MVLVIGLTLESNTYEFINPKYLLHLKFQIDEIKTTFFCCWRNKLQNWKSSLKICFLHNMIRYTHLLSVFCVERHQAILYLNFTRAGNWSYCLIPFRFRVLRFYYNVGILKINTLWPRNELIDISFTTSLIVYYQLNQVKTCCFDWFQRGGIIRLECEQNWNDLFN